jgi:hypothetical protein
LIVDPFTIKGFTISSRTNPFKAMAPSCRIRILLNLFISRGLMPTLFVRQSIENIQKAQTTLQYRSGSWAGVVARPEW